MSQSDYVYLDMQTTNVQMNSTTVTPGNLSFTTDLNTTIVPNDYYMSIDKFQVDTSNVPVLLVEPDLTSPFVPNRTIHKVAVMTEKASLLIDEAYISQINRWYYPTDISTAATSISSSVSGSVFAICFHNKTVNNLEGAGIVVVYNLDRTKIVLQSPELHSYEKFGYSISVSGDGRFIAIGTDESSHYYVYNVSSNTFESFPKNNETRIKVALNHKGNIMIVANIDEDYCILYHKTDDDGWQYQMDFFMNLFGNSPICINRAGDAFAIGFPGYGYISYYKSDENGEWLNGTYAGDNYSFGTQIDMKGPNDTILVSSPFQEQGGKVYKLVPDLPNENIILVKTYSSPTSSFYGELGNLTLTMSEDTLQFYVSTKNLSNNYSENTLWVYVDYDGDTSYGYITPFNNAKTISFGKSTTYGKFGMIDASFHNNTNYFREIINTYNTKASLPEGLKNVPSVSNVIWEQTISPPSGDVLNGINTIQFPYYHCNSYSKFIQVVNNAIANAYIANYSYLANNWINISYTGQSTKSQFFDLITRSFPIPPFLEWDSTKSIAKIYANQFFSEDNYLLPPTEWVSEDGESYTNIDNETPFKLKIAFNASLYYLLNNFPATPTIINNEQFYILEFNSKQQFIDLPSLKRFPLSNLLSKYEFLSIFETSGVITIPYSNQYEYPGSTYYFILEQEFPTTESWNPIYSFALVNPQDIIIKNQVKTLSLHGSSSTSKNEKADFIIKMDGNYRPTFIYNKQTENSNVNLIGTSPITTLEMNVYYISKTGILVPFKLPRGGSASLRILFEKKKKIRN